MKTLLLEVREEDENLFVELAKRLKVKFDYIPNLTSTQEDAGLVNAMKEGRNEGRMSTKEQDAFLNELGL